MPYRRWLNVLKPAKCERTCGRFTLGRKRAACTMQPRGAFCFSVMPVQDAGLIALGVLACCASVFVFRKAFSPCPCQTPEAVADLLAQARKFESNRDPMRLPRIDEDDADIVVSISRSSSTATLEYLGLWNMRTMLATMPVHASLQCRWSFGKWYPVSWQEGWTIRRLPKLSDVFRKSSSQPQNP